MSLLAEFRKDPGAQGTHGIRGGRTARFGARA